MKFFNREKEIREILNLIETEPKLINFIYGPINSGKTALIKAVITKLNLKKYLPFYIDFRMKNIVYLENFVESLFKIDERVKARTVEEYLEKVSSILIKNTRLIKVVGSYLLGVPTNIPVPKEILENLVKVKEIGLEKKVQDIYSYIEELFIKLRLKEIIPILILDELQMLKEVTLNGNRPLLKSFFQFLVGLTKAHHLAHVFCISSDSLFIEHVYSTGELKGRARYVLVDDFEKKKALEFIDFYSKHVLKKVLDKKEKEKIYKVVGGKPIYLISVIDELKIKPLEEILNTFLQEEKQKLIYFLEEVEEKDTKLYKEILEVLKLFLNKEIIQDRLVKRKLKYFLISKNILFLDPVKGILKPQSKLIWHAIRKVLSELEI